MCVRKQEMHGCSRSVTQRGVYTLHFAVYSRFMMCLRCLLFILRHVRRRQSTSRGLSRKRNEIVEKIYQITKYVLSSRQEEYFPRHLSLSREKSVIEEHIPRLFNRENVPRAVPRQRFIVRETAFNITTEYNTENYIFHLWRDVSI